MALQVVTVRYMSLQIQAVTGSLQAVTLTGRYNTLRDIGGIGGEECLNRVKGV